ncbi:hypothetical protein AN189_13115 [Loktanella sp. 3ANDIMAR09]|uniref:phage tail protein n=1 Tax=Loktanella sp. 3ANDIMAR09 TaxID=1225657 RepID=UPI0007019E95|nr:phage tail protein [Loktanella sp. 3ANDIMAR09]KQI68001.1 hypothetical protein AN189_13115 [Loktanella sp. 3ANDIMAR09]
MLGLLGDTPIGFDPLTGPVGQSDTERARIVRHNPVRGTPILQDLGDDNRTRSLRFFLDETFCDVEAEINRLRSARQVRTVLQLFLSLGNLSVGGYLIEQMTIERRKTSPAGRIVRAEVSVDLVEASSAISGQGIAATFARALISPFVRR